LFNALRICEAATEVEVFSKAYLNIVSKIAKVDKQSCRMDIASTAPQDVM
jgi:hypothetical protein